MQRNLDLFSNEPDFPSSHEEEVFYSAYDKKKRIKNCDNVMHFFESRLRAAGYRDIAGVDEAGRGPLAGPVVASAVILPEGFHVEGLYDSKSISEKVRDRIYSTLTSRDDIYWAVGIVDNLRIDSINILAATYQAVREAYSKLSKRPEFLLNDAMIVPEIKTGQRKIIKGDAKSASIAAASIIAKVTRDRMMDEYDRKYPVYGFARHKGYGTAGHIEAIKKHGYCDIHRRSFNIGIEG